MLVTLATLAFLAALYAATRSGRLIEAIEDLDDAVQVTLESVKATDRMLAGWLDQLRVSPAPLLPEQYGAARKELATAEKQLFAWRKRLDEMNQHYAGLRSRCLQMTPEERDQTLGLMAGLRANLDALSVRLVQVNDRLVTLEDKMLRLAGNTR